MTNSTLPLGQGRELFTPLSHATGSPHLFPILIRRLPLQPFKSLICQTSPLLLEDQRPYSHMFYACIRTIVKKRVACFLRRNTHTGHKVMLFLFVKCI